MIISGLPEEGLQKHQQDAYKAVTNSLKAGNRATVVIPTGCGKSFISLQLMEDNREKNILFIAPTIAIKNQMYKYIAKYVVGEAPTEERTERQIAEEHFPNLKIMLYPTLLRMDNEMLEKLKPDIIIMDELHRTGADKWGPKVNTLLDMYSEAKVLGLTATPDRMDDKNVVDDLFEGNISYELTLVEAIKRGIVKPPKYVKCDYELRDMLVGIAEQIKECDDKETRERLEEKLDKMRKIVDQAEGIPELFAKNMTKKDGKYIVFCKDKEHMKQMMEEAKKWFAEIDSKPEMYYVYSGNDKSLVNQDGENKHSNEQQIKRFEESKSNHLKLLFSIDMLNEGLHVEDISGVIMLRPTDSRIIYLQQLGRALSSDKTREQTIVFDLVNNYLKNNLDREINDKSKREISNERKEREVGPEEEIEEKFGDEDIDIFRIQGETKAFLELFEEINEELGKTYLIKARKIKAWMEERGTTKPPSPTAKDLEEKKLGTALSSIRQQLIKPYLGLTTEEAKVKYREDNPELEEILEIVKLIDENRNKLPANLINARKIKKWMEERGTTKPPSKKAKDLEEKSLGNALTKIRQKLINLYIELTTEEEKKKYREEHPELEEVEEIVKWIDENKNRNKLPPYLVNARKIKKWMEERRTTIPPSEYTEDLEEKRLGKALEKIRGNLIKPYLGLTTEEEKEQFRKKHLEFEEVQEIVKWIDERNLENAREIKKWMEERGTTKPPSHKSKDAEEKRLGIALRSIRQKLIKQYLGLKIEEKKEKYREEHPELEEVLQIVTEIDLNSSDKKRQELAALIIQDEEARKKLKEARKLEAQYEQKQKRKGKDTGENDGK